MNMKKKYQKITKIVRQKVGSFLVINPSSIKATNLFFIVTLVVAISYALLIIASAKKLSEENNVFVPPKDTTQLERDLKKIVKGKPIETMVPFIAQKDKKVAAYLIAIAKKESNWGKFSPSKEGKECYNYWGYRGSYNRTDSGYSCFDSPKQAVRVVGKRMGELIAMGDGTPQAMSVWKCGYDCSWDNPASVNKWVKDVGYYYNSIYQ
jgi:hypothetical protein